MSQKTSDKGKSYEVIKVQLDNVFMTLEASYIEQLVESSSEDTELRDHIYHRIRVLKDFMRIIDLIIAEGKISQADIIRLAKIEGGERKDFF